MTDDGSDMLEAIALSSPGGRMSKRTRRAAEARLRDVLFGELNGGIRPQAPAQPTKAESLRRRAGELRELADRGMKPRAYARRADELDAQADAIESEGDQQ